MHRIIPELILENYRAGRMRGSFEAASLFLDISGFSALTDTLMGQGRDGAEALAVTMRALFDPIAEAIFGQGGIIVGYAGDSITALYPFEGDQAPAAREALASAYRIQQDLAANPLFETPFGSFRISAKVGLGIGRVAWGILRSRTGNRAVYYFRGEAVEGAAQAEQNARAGDIVFAEGIYEKLRDTIETQPVQHLRIFSMLRGKLPAARPAVVPALDPVLASVFAPTEVVAQDMRGEFRQTVPLFVRLPELPDNELQVFMYLVFELLRRYGGMIERIDFGDKGCNMFILWGAPVAHEDDVDRALSFVLDLRTRTTVPITAGISYYNSYVGYVGGRLSETYTAYGWGVNLAARLMMGASPNEIWLDERVLQRVSGRFHCAYVGEQTFKGFAQKQKVYVLGGHKTAADVAFRGPMAGRQAELQAMSDFVAPIWDGKYAGVAGVWGEAGMGKSRLVYEFRHSQLLHGRECLWAVCQSDAILPGYFGPFRDWLLRYFETLPEQDRTTRQQYLIMKLDQLIAATANGTLAEELRHARWFLAALVELEWREPSNDQLDPQARYDNTILALIALLKAESLRQPLIVFLEDAQNLDEDSRAFLLRLKRALMADPDPYPIAILMAARWQGTKVLLEDGLVDREMDLTGLSDESISAMCDDFLGGAAAPALIKLLIGRADGNPMFAEQILHFLREQDLLEADATGAWDLKRSANPSALPRDISAMLVARLDQLATPVKETIQAASVLGRVFDVPVLERMLVDGRTLPNQIATAEKAAVWSPLSENQYVFNHALLRDVAYNMQLQSRRRELHALAFDALCESFGSDITRHYEELAYHSEQAVLASEARLYLSLAGDEARDGYQGAQALDYYRRALGFVPTTDLEEQYRLHRECEKIMAERGMPAERAQQIEALQALAEGMDDRGSQAEVMLLRAHLADSNGTYEAAVELASHARDMALEAGRPDVAIGASRGMLDAYYSLGKYKEALDCGEAGLSLAHKYGIPEQEASILNTLGLTLLEMKNPSAARANFEQALAIFRSEENLRGVAKVMANLALVAGYQGNYNMALDYSEQALRLSREIGSRSGECLLLGNMGWIIGLLGDYVTARDYSMRNVRIAREIGERRLETWASINLSSHAGALGETAAAIQYAEQALELAQKSNDRNAEAWALTYLGHGLFESKLMDDAKRAYQRAFDLRTEMGQPVLATEPAAGLARIHLLEGDGATARTRVDSVMAQLDEDSTLEGTDHPLRVYLSVYLVLHGLNDQRAKTMLSTAHAMLRTRANGITDPAARQVFIENISYNREILSLWENRH